MEKLGWYWLGRLRHCTLVRPIAVHGQDDWVPPRALYEPATSKLRDMGLMDTVMSNPRVCRVAPYREAARGRKDRNLKGDVVHSSHEPQARRTRARAMAAGCLTFA